MYARWYDARITVYTPFMQYTSFYQNHTCAFITTVSESYMYLYQNST